MDNGQARPQRESVQEGSEEEFPYKRPLSRQRFGAELDADVQLRPDPEQLTLSYRNIYACRIKSSCGSVVVVCQKGVVAADPFYHPFVLEELGKYDRLVVVEPESLGFVCGL